MYKILLLLVLLPATLFAQETKRKNTFFLSTSQGITFLRKESFSNTTLKTFNTGIGYAYKFEGGYSILSKSGKSFSDIAIGINSCSNRVDIVDSRTIAEGKPVEPSTDRFNLLEFKYSYSRYVRTIKKFPTFFSVGVQFSYILNQRTTVNYFDGQSVVTKKGSNISNNYVITTSPTLLFSYGVDLENHLFRFVKKSRLSLDFTYDMHALGLMSSPANQYSGIYLTYQVHF